MIVIVLSLLVRGQLLSMPGKTSVKVFLFSLDDTKRKTSTLHDSSSHSPKNLGRPSYHASTLQHPFRALCFVSKTFGKQKVVGIGGIGERLFASNFDWT